MTSDDSVPKGHLGDSLSPADLPPEDISLLLLARAQAGDGAALEDLIGRYEGRLRRIVRVRLANNPLARVYDSVDLVQDTFAAALPKIDSLVPTSRSALLNWLATIASNRLHDVWKHECAAKRDMRRNDSKGASEHVAQPPTASQDGPMRQAMHAELQERMDDAVAKLSDSQREVVVLRDYCCESWAHIAIHMDREQGAAKQLHQRAWINIRRTLGPLIERDGLS